MRNAAANNASEIAAVTRLRGWAKAGAEAYQIWGIGRGLPGLKTGPDTLSPATRLRKAQPRTFKVTAHSETEPCLGPSTAIRACSAWPGDASAAIYRSAAMLSCYSARVQSLRGL